MRIRVRGPQGVAQINLADTATWSELQKQIAEKSGVSDFELKYSYPPKSFDSSSIKSDTLLSDLPVNLNGEQLIVTPKSSSRPEPSAGPSSASMPSTTATPAKAQTAAPSKPIDFNPQTSTAPLSLTRKHQLDMTSDPPTVPVPGLGGTMVLRVMPDDNSCMFRAISSACLGAELDGMVDLRSVVAQAIQANPELYSKAVLEQEPDEYCRWIQREDSWGGGIELSILSQFFDMEICSVNVQDGRVDMFNEGKSKRCILVYSGIHYDVVAVMKRGSTVAEPDIKIFPVLKVDGADFDGGALDAARVLCEGLRKRHYYTDTKGFDIKCNTCGQRGKGEQWAVQHATATGHQDFGEG